MRLTDYKAGTVLLDDDDAWVLDEYWLRPRTRKGYHAVYAVCKKTNRETSLGRVLLKITDPELQADHINGDGFDNRRENLRVVGRDLQNANRQFVNSLGYKGVDMVSQFSYRAVLSRNGKSHKGFARSSPERAALDYNRMAIALWGNDVFLNEVRCVSLDPRPADANCMFCNAPCHCCCVCFDPPSKGMKRILDTLDA